MKLIDLPIGAKVKDLNTKYYGSPIVWKVAAKNHEGYPVKSVTLLSDKILCLKPFDAREPGNADGARANYGNNRYLYSNLRQWLNKKGLPWFERMHSSDRSPIGGAKASSSDRTVEYNPYDTEQGFLTNFSSELLGSLLDTNLITIRNKVDSGGSEIVTDKIFLPSATELGIANESGVTTKEGVVWELFRGGTSEDRKALVTDGAFDNSEYKSPGLTKGGAWDYYLRTPVYAIDNTHQVRLNSGGNSSGVNHGSYGVRPAMNVASELGVSDIPDSDGYYVLNFNFDPSLILFTENNRTLYENDTLSLEGSASDADNGNIVNVRYQINAGPVRALATGISDGSTPIAFNKKLTAKGGALYDGATAITAALAEGVAHTLKVWAEDDQGGKSAVEERTFYVVPNRPPALSIDPFEVQSNLINHDSITISGEATDPDGNDVKVNYKLNDGLATQVHTGPGAPFTFDIKLADLKAGENLIIVEVVDSYNFKTSKTIKLNKNENLTPLLQSTQRYEIVPPSGEAKGVLLWIQRDKNLTVNALASMSLSGEQENYQPMTLTNSAPVTLDIIEDEYIIEAVDPKQKIMLKLELSRPGTDVDPAVSLISGVLS